MGTNCVSAVSDSWDKGSELKSSSIFRPVDNILGEPGNENKIKIKWLLRKK